MRTNHIVAKDVKKPNKIEKSLSDLDSLYRRRYEVGSSRMEDKKIKTNLRILLENNLLGQCGYGKKIDLTRSINLHGCNKAAAYYFLCFNILSRNNASPEELWTCHGLGRHNDTRVDGTAIMSLPDIYQPLMEFFDGRVTAVRALQNPAFEHLIIESALALNPPPLDIQFAYSKRQKVVVTIDYQIINGMSLNELENKIKKFHDAYYDYGLNKDFDRVIDALLTKIEELKPADYDFGPVDHFMQQREIFNTCEQLKHAGKVQKALALKDSNIPSLSYHTFNLDSAGDFATRQRRIVYTKILQEKASTSEPMIDSASEEIGMMGPVGDMAEALAMQKHAAFEVSVAEPMLKFDAQVTFTLSKHEQDNGLEQLTTTESIKAQVKENMSAEKSKDYASTEEKPIAEAWRKISLDWLFNSRRSNLDIQDTEYHPNTPTNSELGGLSIK